MTIPGKIYRSTLKQQQGVTLTELMIAMTLGLILLQSGYVVYTTFLKTHRQVYANQFSQDQAAYVFHWLHHYSRLTHLNSNESLNMPDVSNHFKTEFAQRTNTTQNQWLVFRIKLPKTEQYSCDGSIFQWPNGSPVLSDVMVIFWLDSEQKLICRTWVKQANNWCSMPIHNGDCTLLGGANESFLNLVEEFNISIYANHFWVQLRLNMGNGSLANSVYEGQFILRQKQWP